MLTGWLKERQRAPGHQSIVRAKCGNTTSRLLLLEEPRSYTAAFEQLLRDPGRRPTPPGERGPCHAYNFGKDGGVLQITYERMNPSGIALPSLFFSSSVFSGRGDLNNLRLQKL